MLHDYVLVYIFGVGIPIIRLSAEVAHVCALLGIDMLAVFPSIIYWCSIILIPVAYVGYLELHLSNAIIIVNRIDRLGEDNVEIIENLRDEEELRILHHVYGQADLRRLFHVPPFSRISISIKVIQLSRWLTGSSVWRFLMRILIGFWSIMVLLWDHFGGETRCERLQIELNAELNRLTNARDDALRERNQAREERNILQEHRTFCLENHQHFDAQDANRQRIDELERTNERLVEENRLLTRRNAELHDNDARTVARLIEAFNHQEDLHRAQTTELNRSIAESDIQIATLTDQVRALHDDLAAVWGGHLPASVRDLEQERTNLQFQMLDNERRFIESIRVRDELIERGNLRALFRADATTQATLQQLNALLAERNEELAELRHLREGFIQNHERCEAEKTAIRNEALRAEPTRLQGLLETAQREVRDRDAELRRLEFYARAENNLETAQNEFEEQRRALREEINERDHERAVFRRQIEVAWQTLGWAPDRFGDIDMYIMYVPASRRELRTQAAEIEQLRFQIDASAGHSIDGREVVLTELRGQVNRLEDANQALTRRLELAQAEVLRRSEAQLAEGERTLELINGIRALQADLNAARARPRERTPEPHPREPWPLWGISLNYIRIFENELVRRNVNIEQLPVIPEEHPSSGGELALFRALVTAKMRLSALEDLVDPDWLGFDLSWRDDGTDTQENRDAENLRRIMNGDDFWERVPTLPEAYIDLLASLRPPQGREDQPDVAADNNPLFPERYTEWSALDRTRWLLDDVPNSYREERGGG